MREDWVECKVGDIFDFVGGGTPSTTNEKYWNGSIPWASIKDIKGDFLTSTINKISEAGLTNSSSNLVAIDEVILATRINPGRPIISKINTAINQDLKVVKPKTELPSIFIFYLFKFLEKEIIGLSSGTTVLGIGLNPLKEIRFNLPPLPEQRAIVKKLESLFSSLDAGVADLKKAQQQLKIYRQAVLKKAFDINATAYSLLEICEEMFAGGDKPKDFFSDEKNLVCNVPIFANAVKDKGLYGFTKNARVTKNAITIAGRGSGTGYVEIRNEPFFPIVRLIVLVPKTALITLKFLYFFLKNFNIEVSGSAIPQLTIPMIKDYQINIPTIEKQNQIVKEIESRLSVCDSIEQNIKESLSKAEALRQSILKKSFEGNLLTAQELAECKLEKDYEPASVLLERIEAERSKVSASKKKIKII